MTDWTYSYPAASEVYTMLIAHLNSAFNPVLYGIYNPLFRKGYKNVWNRITRRKEERIHTEAAMQESFGSRLTKKIIGNYGQETVQSVL